jgi:uncharacterized membrane protein YkoI
MRYPAALVIVAAAAVACGPGGEPAEEEHAAVEEESPGLFARATVTPEEAQAIVLEQSEGGTIVEAELEEEGDLLVYSFEVRQADGSVLDVEVDAMSGEVLSEEEDDEEDEDDDEDENEGEDEDDDEHEGQRGS